MKKKSAGRLWVRLWKGHRFVRDVTVPCTRDNPQSALREALHELDLGMPVWLPRHQTDWESFALTSFRPEHFMEAVPFERMEISYIFPEDEEKPKRARDELYD